MKSNKSLADDCGSHHYCRCISISIYESYGSFQKGTNHETVQDLNGKDKVHVQRVVDGDTFIANQNGKEIKVRLMGLIRQKR